MEWNELRFFLCAFRFPYIGCHILSSKSIRYWLWIDNFDHLSDNIYFRVIVHFKGSKLTWFLSLLLESLAEFRTVFPQKYDLTGK